MSACVTTNIREHSRYSKPAAALESAAIDGDLYLVREDAVAHPVAARPMDDVQVDPRRLVNFAGEAVDRLRRRLPDGLRSCQREGDVMLVDQHIPERLRPNRVIGRGGGGGSGAQAAMASTAIGNSFVIISNSP